MTDTHTHIYMPDAYPGEEADTVRRAVEAGVHTMILANVDNESISPLLSLQEQFPDNVFAAMGLHPTEVNPDWKQELSVIKKYLTHPGVVAIGEVGMDFYQDDTYADEQAEAFRTQLQWAKEKHLPVIIHQRGALDRTLEILHQEYTPDIPGIVFHCFTEDENSVEAIRRVMPDAYFGIGGVVTFKNAPALRRALHVIGLQHIVLETDAPWLAPTPYRGKRNESAYIPLIAERIAEELGLPSATVEAATDDNARRLFGLAQA